VSNLLPGNPVTPGAPQPGTVPTETLNPEWDPTATQRAWSHFIRTFGISVAGHVNRTERLRVRIRQLGQR
jgi:hypothetical protein